MFWRNPLGWDHRNFRRRALRRWNSCDTREGSWLRRRDRNPDRFSANWRGKDRWQRSRTRRNPYRRNPSVDITFKMNLKTGKKDIFVEVHSDDDTMPHEHERDHKRIVEQLVGKGLIGAAEAGEVTIKRVKSPPSPLKGREEPPERQAVATRYKSRKNPLPEGISDFAYPLVREALHNSKGLSDAIQYAAGKRSEAQSIRLEMGWEEAHEILRQQNSLDPSVTPERVQLPLAALTPEFERAISSYFQGKRIGWLPSFMHDLSPKAKKQKRKNRK